MLNKTAFSLLFICTGLVLNAQKDFFSGIILPDSTSAISKDSAFAMSLGIKAANLIKHIHFLASDSCEGRELGSRGIEIAAGYISNQFRSSGIKPIPQDTGFTQDIEVEWMYWDKISLSFNGVPFKQLWDFICIPANNKDLELIKEEVVFLGYGIDDPKYSDYENVNVKDKIILIYNGEPKNSSGRYYITNSTQASKWSGELRYKLEAAKSRGAKLVLIIEDNFKKLVEESRSSVVSPQVILNRLKDTNDKLCNVIHLSSTTSTLLLEKNFKKVVRARKKISRTGKPQSFSFPSHVEINQKHSGRIERGKNIVAFIEGTDLNEECLVVSAHYDHIGKRANDIFNGADDNASGTSGVIEMAKLYQDLSNNGIKPKRSIAFILMTGEEKGLLGSLYYVNNPIFPLEGTVANINVDMIGRVDDKYKTDSNYIYVIGSDRISPDLHLANIEINERYTKIKLDHTFNSESDPNRFYYRSDHYNFAEKNIPCIFFFSGVHEDYHRITDDIEKIMPARIEKIVRHIFLLSWNLANRPGDLRLN